tara:strand:- start:547 stop:1113 length:567 start_codon:yes stop_codon:yes gene_type:complete
MANILTDKPIITVLVLVAVVALVWVVYQEWYNVEETDVVEAFENSAPAEETVFASSNDGVEDDNTSVAPAEDDQESDPRPVANDDTNNKNQLPAECYPKDVLNSVDLLPRDANSLHAQVVPSGQGALSDQNFLTAGYHIGINTVGQTLRNANRQLRSEPPNPQVKVSPWNQTTIETDVNRRPLEIGGQ